MTISTTKELMNGNWKDIFFPWGPYSIGYPKWNDFKICIGKTWKKVDKKNRHYFIKKKYFDSILLAPWKISTYSRCFCEQYNYEQFWDRYKQNVVDPVTSYEYDNDPKSLIRYKCFLLCILGNCFHQIYGFFYVQKKIIENTFLYPFWKTTHKNICFGERFKAWALDIFFRILCAPIFIFLLQFFAFLGIFCPYEGRKYYAIFARIFYGKYFNVLGRCFQPKGIFNCKYKKTNEEISLKIEDAKKMLQMYNKGIFPRDVIEKYKIPPKKFIEINNEDSEFKNNLKYKNKIVKKWNRRIKKLKQGIFLTKKDLNKVNMENFISAINKKIEFIKEDQLYNYEGKNETLIEIKKKVRKKFKKNKKKWSKKISFKDIDSSKYIEIYKIGKKMVNNFVSVYEELANNVENFIKI